MGGPLAAFVIESLKGSGNERKVAEIATALCANGRVRAEVWPLWAPHDLVEQFAPVVRRVRTALRSPERPTPRAAWRWLLEGGVVLPPHLALRGLLRAARPDLVVSNLWFADVVTYHEVRRHPLPLPWVIRIGTMPDPRSAAMQARVLGAADLVIAISHSAARALLERGVERGRLRVIHNGFDVERLRAMAAEASVPSERFVIVSSGRLVFPKGFHVLLHAFHAALRHVRDAELWILGSGRRRARFEAEAARLGLADRVRFLGWRANPYPYVARADLAVFLPRREEFGNAIGEAMALGRPVVASRVGGIPEFVEHGKTGWLVPPEDPGAAARAIVTLAADRPHREALGRAAAEAIRTRFSAATMAERYAAALEEAMRRSRGDREATH